MPLTKVRGSGIGQITSALDVNGILTTTSTGTNLSSNSYNVVKIQTDKDDNGSNDDAILQFTNGSSNTVKGEIRFDESENMLEFGTGDNQGHLRIDSNGHVILKKNLALDMSTSEGIDFGAAGSSANTLDDYEEGTWTPAFVGVTNTPGLHNNVGRYTRIGRLVVLQFFQQTSGSPAPTFSNNSAAFQISGVPFSVQGHGYTGSQGSMNAQAFNYNGSFNTQSTQADFCSPNVNGSDLLEFQVTDSGSTRGVMNNNGAKQSPYVVEVTISYFTDA